jgi:hypothetical protein
MRKWIYNPNIHGDEQEWRNNIDLYFKVIYFIRSNKYIQV